MSEKLSRKDFLKLTAAGAGAAALTACGVKPAPTAEIVTPTMTALPSNTPQAVPTNTEAVAATATPEPQSPDLVVVRNAEPEVLVRRALQAMGGIGKYVKQGSDVIIKPNICVSFRTYEYGATTNPWLVGELVRMCFEAGASRVRVMDHTWRREMTDAYINSGIQEQVELAGGEMEWMPRDKFVPTDIPLGVDLKSLDIYDEIVNADVLINVPIAKHHQDAKLTLAMKNLMGCMDNRLTMHVNQGQRIADLSSRIRPTLNIMDAVRIMTMFGPTGGLLRAVKKIDTVVASEDIVAIDSYTASFFDMSPEDLEYVVAAAKMGIGRSDLENLRIEEIDLG
jgi:uncharacterized protein (DUF362 family)